MSDVKFEVWVYLTTPNRYSGRAGWHMTGKHETREQAEGMVRIGRRANPDVTYEVRDVAP